MCFRNSVRGSWFIQEMCKVFSSYGKRDDVLTLFMRITKYVAGNYYNEKNSNYQKQMPVFISTLTKKYYLNRNKERDLLLKMDVELEKMSKDIKAIKENLSKLLLQTEKKRNIH